MRGAALLLLCGLAAACAALPEVEPPPLPVELPAGWTAGEAAPGALSDTWWRDLGDPGLDEVVREALRQNPDLKAAQARVAQAAALARMAGADLFPSLSAGGQGGVRKQFIGTNLGPFVPATVRSESYGVSLDLSWEIDLWGRVRAGRAAALADARAAEALLAGARLSLAAQTAKAWFAAVEAGGQLAVARANLESAGALADRIRDRYRRGLMEAIDVKLAETEVERARAEAALWERSLDAARRQVETLAGRYPAGRLAAGAELPEPPGPLPAGVPASVLARRPDLAAAELQYLARARRVQEASAARYPAISLTGSKGFASEDFSDILRGDYHVWAFAGNVLAPIVSGGRIDANVDLQEARRDEAGAAFAGAVLKALREVETGLAAERHLRRRETALSALAAKSKESLDLAEDRYLRGLGTILKVLDARRSYYAARSALLSVRRELILARIDLIVALGGGIPGRTEPGEGKERS